MRPDADKATTDQLREDIDQGRTGDKVRFPDPAAAPLGTDDEAAGQTPSPGTIAHARRSEGARAGPARDETAKVQLRTWLFLGAAIAVLAALLWAAVS